jgi:hypothetical protein
MGRWGNCCAYLVVRLALLSFEKNFRSLDLQFKFTALTLKLVYKTNRRCYFLVRQGLIKQNEFKHLARGWWEILGAGRYDEGRCLFRTDQTSSKLQRRYPDLSPAIEFANEGHQ